MRLVLGTLLPIATLACSVQPQTANDAGPSPDLTATGANAASPMAVAPPANLPEPTPFVSGNKKPAASAGAESDPLYIPAATLTATEEALVDRATRENGNCRGGLGNQPSTLDACERRQVLMRQLEKAGLCWGGATIEAQMHWVRCADDPAFTPGQFDKPYYTPEERRELLEQ